MRHRGQQYPLHVADGQVGWIVQAIVLPDAWMDRVLAKLQLQEETARIQKEHQAVVIGSGGGVGRLSMV